MTHQLKIHPEYFTEVSLGLKKVEIRLNDRNYKEHDRLILKEYDPITQEYTGETLVRIVRYVIRNCPGLNPDYVVLQIEKPI